MIMKTVHVTPEIHKKLKLVCAEEELKIYEFLEKLINKYTLEKKS